MSAEALQTVLRRIEAAASAAGRPGQVRLLAVSKKQPAERVRALAAVGQQAFGENYVQEGLDKIAQLSDLALEWHHIGPIQSNKTADIAAHFDWAHGIDREKIARRLSEQRPAGRPPLNVCVQVNISGERSKSGVAPADTAALCHAVATLPGLRLRGLMAIPAPAAGTGEDPRAPYAALRALYGQLRDEGLALDTLSAGMSDDLEHAIAEGATLVRVGTALFGAREA
jgi:pyridoxal phosphate enzyme (YggS family)